MVRRHAITAQVDSQSTVPVNQVLEDGVSYGKSCPERIEKRNTGSTVESNDVPGARRRSANGGVIRGNDNPGARVGQSD